MDKHFLNLTRSIKRLTNPMKCLILCAISAGMLLLSNCKKELAAPVAVSSVSLDKDSLNILIGNTDSLKATVSPANAGNGKVTWSTSDNTIATVDGGHISAKALGSVTITATSQDGTHSASCPVKVEDMGYFINAAATYSLVSGQNVPTESVFFSITNNSAYPINIVEWDVYNSKNAPIGTVTVTPVETTAPGAAWTSTTQSFKIGLYEPGQTTLQNWLVMALFNCEGKKYELVMSAQQATVTDL